ncbi:hypothetical protein NEMBOFW57_006742 [Staphylotrichum longicolle]|uniref:NACHT domain-containing protein n=1 Tax=Staphylotrichum longicolle TaxID=669026 RepID=A0AAD4HXQ8_9PEZI|nr:hypothetical protein NEMBOFW57_006742 [Staphylotrichum longicolle]
MDPVTAVGLASGIVAFITLSTSLVKGAIKIHESLDGNLDENRSREAIASEMSRFAARLLPPDCSHLAGEEKALCVLATECRDLSVKLRELLGRIKPKEPRSKSQSLWSVLKNKVTEKEKAELELLLDHCRSQFNLQLAFVNKSLLHSLVESARNDAAKLELLRSNFDDLRARIEDLRQGVQVAGFSFEAQGLIRQLVDVQENAFSAIVQGRILDALAFEEMHGRSEMVEEAHYRTFRWILADDNEDDVRSTRYAEAERREMHRAAGNMFTNWLSSGEGIFHISGKLGSGKSTLMKYLGDHPGTKTELIKWADGRDLVVAKFFFWRPGTPKQKSLYGLYRFLLHDILKSRPELIPETFHELCDEARATPWQVQTTLFITEKDIRRAFARLIQCTNRADANHCFCFFIDGLDEYQETAQSDLKEMVRLLTSWTVAAPRHVKLCVSSREYNVFMNSFSAEKRLRVHELTRFDMEAYIRDKLDGIADEVAKHELVSAIVAKAEGIFQWVTLVVKQIREELENGADSVALIQLVDSLPDELDRLYQHVLQSLSKSDRRKVYQTFAILSLANQWELSVSLFAYSFLEDYGADPTFAEREDFVQRARACGDGGTVEYRVELGRKRVRGWCKGLVEPVSIGRAGSDEVMIIDYAHRSIPDSLENKTIKDEMEAFLAGFSPAEALCQLILTEIRLDSHHRKPRICSAEFLAAVMGPLVKMRHAHHLDHAPFTYLRVLDTFADPWCWKKLEMGSTDLAIWVQDHWSGFFPIAQMNKDPGPVRTSHSTRWGSAQSTSLPGVLYQCALLIPGHEYPKWRIENDPTATDSVAKTPISLAVS